MVGEDSLDFMAKYKDWSVSRSLSVASDTDPKQVSFFLISVREQVDKKAFEILGIDLKAIDAYSERITSKMPTGSYKELVGIYKTLGSAEVEEVVNRSSNAREELKPFAKAYILRSALEKMGLDHYIKGGSKTAGNAANGAQLRSEGIVFMAKYKEWVSIKKMSVDEKTKPEEVAAHLSSVRMALDRKIAEIMGIDIETLDMYATNMTGTMRKSAANLEKITGALSEAEAMKAVESSCKGDKALQNAARTYLFAKMLENLKLDLEVNPNTLMDMFPGLKIPKPKGNFGGKKKKKQ